MLLCKLSEKWLIAQKELVLDINIYILLTSAMPTWFYFTFVHVQFVQVNTCYSSVNIVTELLAGWPGFDSQQRQGFFSLCRHVLTGPGALPASYKMDTGYSLLGGNVAGAWSWTCISIQCRGEEWVEL